MSNPEIIKFEDSIEALLDDRRAVWLTVDQICKLLELKERVVRHHIANWKDVDPEAASKGVQHFGIQTNGGIQSTAHYSPAFIQYIKSRLLLTDYLETTDYHEIVARWLNANGFEYEHEVPMPILGRADFVATRDGVTYVIECKLKATQGAVYQVMAYREQTGHTPLILTYQPASPDLVHKAKLLGVDVVHVGNG